MCDCGIIKVYVKIPLYFLTKIKCGYYKEYKISQKFINNNIKLIKQLYLNFINID